MGYNDLTQEGKRLLWWENVDNGRSILDELLEGEFNHLIEKDCVHFLIVHKFHDDRIAEARTPLRIQDPPCVHIEHACISFASQNWFKYHNFNSPDMRRLLRHECLHLLVGLDINDSDSIFMGEAKRRNIGVGFRQEKRHITEYGLYPPTGFKENYIVIEDDSKQKELNFVSQDALKEFISQLAKERLSLHSIQKEVQRMQEEEIKKIILGDNKNEQ